MNTSYLDKNLSLAVSTSPFLLDKQGRESLTGGFYALAIRRIGYPECSFRFSASDRADARSTLQALNRSGEESR
jgi:hypothetical protein